jgi:hypothetical protein
VLDQLRAHASALGAPRLQQLLRDFPHDVGTRLEHFEAIVDPTRITREGRVFSLAARDCRSWLTDGAEARRGSGYLIPRPGVDASFDAVQQQLDGLVRQRDRHVVELKTTLRCAPRRGGG